MLFNSVVNRLPLLPLRASFVLDLHILLELLVVNGNLFCELTEISFRRVMHKPLMYV